MKKSYLFVNTEDKNKDAKLDCIMKDLNVENYKNMFDQYDYGMIINEAGRRITYEIAKKYFNSFMIIKTNESESNFNIISNLGKISAKNNHLVSASGSYSDITMTQTRVMMNEVCKNASMFDFFLFKVS